MPNERSSHSVPTPRGGGLAIVVAALAAVAAGVAAGLVDRPLAWALLGGGGAVAAVGWVDDRVGLPARVRAPVHLLAAVWAAWWLGGLPSLDLGPAHLPLGAAGAVFAVLWIVWATNLYNFMDGIDGLAGGEAVCVGALMAWLTAARAPGLATAAAAVAASSCGFLLSNWPPARIFMGDVGSGFLGFAFGALALAADRAGALPFAGGVVLLGTFVFDATATLFRRAWRGERVYEAHRSHAYQRAVSSGLSHRRVTSGALALTLALGALVAAAPRLPGGLLGAAVTATALLWAVSAWIGRRAPAPRARPSGDAAAHRTGA